MMGRMTICPLTTTGRSLIECIPERKEQMSNTSCTGENILLTQNSGLRQVDNRGAVERSKDTTVGARNFTMSTQDIQNYVVRYSHGECTSSHILDS